MGKREKPQSASWESQPSPPPSHLSIVIAHFFYRCTAVRVNLSSSVPSAIANHTTMNYDRSSGGVRGCLTERRHHVRRNSTMRSARYLPPRLLGATSMPRFPPPGHVPPSCCTRNGKTPKPETETETRNHKPQTQKETTRTHDPT